MKNCRPEWFSPAGAVWGTESPYSVLVLPITIIFPDISSGWLLIVRLSVNIELITNASLKKINP
jgi:hypothetical protein